jgi:hypothetical protein
VQSSGASGMVQSSGASGITENHRGVYEVLAKRLANATLKTHRKMLFEVSIATVNPASFFSERDGDVGMNDENGQKQRDVDLLIPGVQKPDITRRDLIDARVAGQL